MLNGPMTWSRARRILLDRAYLRVPVSLGSKAVHAGYDVADTVTVLGAWRSGTTWIQEMVSSGPGTGAIFEPLHEVRVIDSLGYGPEPAIAAGTAAPALASYLDTVMRGGALSAWTLQLTTIPRALRARRFVVKHVQLNHSAGWIAETFPTSSMLLVVRHPCAVVQSMLAVHWKPPTTAHHLASVSGEEGRQIAELLDGRTSEAAHYAAAWAVGVRAMLAQTDPGQAQIVSYEMAVADPVGVLGAAMETTGLPRPAGFGQRAARPSAMTSSGSVVRASGDPVSAWADGLTREQQDEVLAVVEQAGIAGYGLDPRPDLDALHDQHRRPSPVN